MRELTNAQQEYFKNTQIRGHDGQLITCYHCTDAEFDTFDKAKIGGHNSFYGRGFYFSTSDRYDETFGEQYRGCFGEHRLACYIDMKNPLVLGDLDFFEVETIMKYMRDNHPDYGKEGGPFEIAIDPKEMPKSDDEFKLTPDYWNLEVFKRGAWAAYAEQLTNYAIENGYDGIIEAPLGAGPAEVIVFEPNQIKLVDNLYPTKSANFRDNSQDYIKENKLSPEEQAEVAKNMKKIKQQNRGHRKHSHHKDDLLK